MPSDQTSKDYDNTTDIQNPKSDSFFTNDSSNLKESFEVELYAGKNRTYYFNLKTDKNDSYYLIIREYVLHLNGQQDNYQTIIFEKDIANFQQALEECITYIKSNKKQEMEVAKHKIKTKIKKYPSFSRDSARIADAFSSFDLLEDVMELS